MRGHVDAASVNPVNQVYQGRRRLVSPTKLFSDNYNPDV